jgi:hypothetical protein
MKDTKELDRIIDAAGWGALFMWWGVLLIWRMAPTGAMAVGTGFILLSVSLARRLMKVPVRVFPTALGFIMLGWGGLDLSSSVLRLPARFPVFAILLVALGAWFLLSAFITKHRQPRDGA